MAPEKYTLCRYGYPEMNVLAARSPIGSKGISIIPFGNGAERILKNQDIGCAIRGINFNIHERSDILRAAQEGIVFSFQYGMEIMQEMGMPLQVIRAGKANMFLSPVFRQTLASISGTIIELYNTDGSAGAAGGRESVPEFTLLLPKLSPLCNART